MPRRIPLRAPRFPGFTLLELMTALSVAAILACMAVPAFGALLDDARVSRASNALLGALHYARLQAQARAATVVLCQSADGAHCLTTGAASGWIVFVDTAPGSPIQRDPGDELLQVETLPASVQFSGNRVALSYWPQTRAGTTATLLLCARNRKAAPRAVIVSQTGRPRTSRVDASGDPLVCP